MDQDNRSFKKVTESHFLESHATFRTRRTKNVKIAGILGLVSLVFAYALVSAQISFSQSLFLLLVSMVAGFLLFFYAIAVIAKIVEQKWILIYFIAYLFLGILGFFYFASAFGAALVFVFGVDTTLPIQEYASAGAALLIISSIFLIITFSIIGNKTGLKQFMIAGLLYFFGTISSVFSLFAHMPIVGNAIWLGCLVFLAYAFIKLPNELSTKK